uniref:Suppressor of white apricot N-terminal domain-containing protein n=1 Tax=Neolamprologus brichardi TaxID=32507 RepID=A0A3Q4HTU0_NEOBR
MYRRGAAKKDSKPVKKDVSDSDKYADLLVFGYACKLFRDDEKALYHDHGKHLIPWMGDKSIMIDRVGVCQPKPSAPSTDSVGWAYP